MSAAKPEILAPAGDMQKLKTAILYGADACYLAGRKFGLRAFSANFSDDELREACLYAHARSVKIYVTVNIVALDEDFPALRDFAHHIYDCGADAAIVSDPGVFALFRESVPKLDLHISTQANVSNAAACRFWHRLGAKRIVLARELSLEQIRQIRRQIADELEIECFVHGAMCLAHSGRCLLSAWFNERSANRGECSQPCRWSFELKEKQRTDWEALPFEEDGQGSYLLSSRDTCMIEHIPELIEAGINSFKIEGRMKALYYCAITSKIYKQARDAYLCGKDGAFYRPLWRQELETLVHRPYGSGFYFCDPRSEANLSQNAAYIHAAETLAITVETAEAPCFETLVSALPQNAHSRTLVAMQLKKAYAGENVELVMPEGDPLCISLKRLWAADGSPIDSSPHPRMVFALQIESEERLPAEIPPGSFIRRRV